MMNHVLRAALLVLLGTASAGCLYWPRETDVRTPPAKPSPVRPSAAPESPQAGVGVDQVFIDMTTVRIPAAQVEACLGDLSPAPSGAPRHVTKAQADRLAAAWRADERVRVVQAPKILAIDHTEATLFIGETIRFARTEAATNEAGSLDFRIEDGPAFVGYQMRVTPRIRAGGGRIALDLHAVQRTMLKERTQEEIAAMDQETFLREAVLEERLDAEFDMPNEGHVLLGRPDVRKDADGSYVLIMLLSAKVLQDAQAKAARVSDS